MSDDIRLELTIDGDAVLVEPLDVTGEEWRAIKKASGMTVKQVMEGVSEIDTDAVGALAWNVLRRKDRTLTFEQVLTKITLRTILDATDVSDVDDGEELDPSV